MTGRNEERFFKSHFHAMPDESCCPVGFLESLSQCFSFDRYPPSVFREKIWGDPDFDPSLCLFAKKGEKWCGLVMAVIRNGDVQNPGVIKFLAVPNDFQSQGWGKALMEEIVSRLWGRGVHAIRIGESAPNYLTPGVDPRYTRAFGMLMKMGFKSIGHTFNLEVELQQKTDFFSQELSKIDGDAFSVRRASKTDTDALGSFLQKDWPAWQSEVLPALQDSQPPVFLALEKWDIVGFAGYDCNNKGIGWFGPMGTMPTQQGKGIGRALLYAVLLDMQAKGYRHAIIPWVGPVGFYHKTAGAIIERTFFRMELHRSSGDSSLTST